MSCPICGFPEFDTEHWTVDEFYVFMKCRKCTAEPGDVPWIPDEDEDEDYCEDGILEDESPDDDWDIPF